MLQQLDVLVDSEPRAAALNMAVDEALVEGADVPVLRFYSWIRPAVSFGYFGRYSDVAREATGREIVRRWTGGGIVPHGQDQTYSIIIPANDPVFGQSSPEIYRGVHQAISRALSANGVSASLANGAVRRTSDHCFANPVCADLMSDGRKIAGAAHRRTRRGLLHQGSIQLPDLPDKFLTDLARCLCEGFQLRDPGTALLARAEKIAGAKYGTGEWLMRR